MPKLRILESGRIVCNVKIRPYDSPILRVVEFKIDTGADFSTISKETLHALGYTPYWIDVNKKLMKGTTSVATGEEVKTYNVCLPFISIYGAKGMDYPFAILLDKEKEIPKPTCDGCKYTEAKKFDYRLLLGNDILSCFNINIDRGTGYVHINRLNNLDERNAKYPDRQLNFIETDLNNQ